MQQPPSSPQWPSTQSQVPTAMSNSQYTPPPPQYAPPSPTPMQAPPQWQPAPKKPKRWPLIVGFILVFLIGFGIGRVSGSASNTPAASQPSTQVTQSPQPTQAPTTAQQPASHLKVGQGAAVGPWQITVNSAKTSQGSEFDKPQQAGDVFLLIDVTMKNTSNQQQAATALGQFHLRNAAGEEITMTIVTSAPPAPNGNVAAGAQIRGTLAYEIPGNQHSFTFEGEGGAISTDQVVWDIKV